MFKILIYKPCSQCCPCQPSIHRHAYDPLVFKQLPPFSHTPMSWHSFASLQKKILNIKCTKRILDLNNLLLAMDETIH